MPTELASFYDVLKELGFLNFNPSEISYDAPDYLEENMDMYYELAAQEFPYLFD